MAINGIGFPPPLSPSVDTSNRTPASMPSSTKADAAQGTSFADSLMEAVAEVNAAQKESAQKAGEMSLGITSIDEAMITMEKADLGFRLLTQVRNKVIEAYKEVMRLPI